MDLTSRAPVHNHLLDALSDAEWQRLRPLLEPVEMPLGQVLYESGVQMTHVYFPCTAIVSLQYLMEDGHLAEVAMVGDEGVVGIASFMGGGSTTPSAVVVSAGHGVRLQARSLMEEFDRAGPMMHRLLRYTQALMTQMAQSAVCNRHHSLEQHLCRWLLLILDRLQGREIAVTHELVAHILGVRREGVTVAAHKLQQLGLIRNARAHIEVLDRAGLEQRTCECYDVVRTEYERLLGAPEYPCTGAA